MPPLAPWFLTTLTVTPPNEDPSAMRPAATRDLVTWSATTTVTATPAMAHRTRRDLAAAPSGIIAISTRLRRPPVRWRWRMTAETGSVRANRPFGFDLESWVHGDDQALGGGGGARPRGGHVPGGEAARRPGRPAGRGVGAPGGDPGRRRGRARGRGPRRPGQARGGARARGPAGPGERRPRRLRAGPRGLRGHDHRRRPVGAAAGRVGHAVRRVALRRRPGGAGRGGGPGLALRADLPRR